MKVVLLHGYNVFAKNWLEVVLGIPPLFLGRMVKALKIALEQEVDLLLFGAGIPVKDGKSEAEIEYNELIERVEELSQFYAMRRLVDQYDIRDWLRCKSRIDPSGSRDTLATTRWVKDFLWTGRFLGKESSIDELIIVTDKVHLPRSLNDAFEVLEGVSIEIIGRHSDVPCEGKPGACKVIQPTLVEFMQPELDTLMKRGLADMKKSGLNQAKIQGEE